MDADKARQVKESGDWLYTGDTTEIKAFYSSSGTSSPLSLFPDPDHHSKRDQLIENENPLPSKSLAASTAPIDRHGFRPSLWAESGTLPNKPPSSQILPPVPPDRMISTGTASAAVRTESYYFGEDGPRQQQVNVNQTENSTRTQNQSMNGYQKQRDAQSTGDSLFSSNSKLNMSTSSFPETIGDKYWESGSQSVRPVERKHAWGTDDPKAESRSIRVKNVVARVVQQAHKERFGDSVSISDRQTTKALSGGTSSTLISSSSPESSEKTSESSPDGLALGLMSRGIGRLAETCEMMAVSNTSLRNDITEMTAKLDRVCNFLEMTGSSRGVRENTAALQIGLAEFRTESESHRDVKLAELEQKRLDAESFRRKELREWRDEDLAWREELRGMWTEHHKILNSNRARNSDATTDASAWRMALSDRDELVKRIVRCEQRVMRVALGRATKGMMEKLSSSGICSLGSPRSGIDVGNKFQVCRGGRIIQASGEGSDEISFATIFAKRQHRDE